MNDYRKKVRNPEQQASVRELVTRYGDQWALYCGDWSLKASVFPDRGPDRADASRMRLMERGELSRINAWDIQEAA